MTATNRPFLQHDADKVRSVAVTDADRRIGFVDVSFEIAIRTNDPLGATLIVRPAPGSAAARVSWDGRSVEVPNGGTWVDLVPGPATRMTVHAWARLDLASAPFLDSSDAHVPLTVSVVPKTPTTRLVAGF